MAPPSPPPPPPTTLSSILLSSLPATPWALSRTLSSSNPHEPSGLVSGTATFTPRHPTATGYAGECVYAEEGEMEVNGGLKLRFSRGYVWRFREGEGGDHEGAKGERIGMGGVSLWFLKPETGKVGGGGGGKGGGEVDYLFHELEFLDREAEEDEEREGGKDEGKRERSNLLKVRAKGHHLCVEDVYETQYVFRLRRRRGDNGVTEFRGDRKSGGEMGGDKDWEIESWEVRHTVKGPKKDQRLWSVYTRGQGP